MAFVQLNERLPSMKIFCVSLDMEATWIQIMVSYCPRGLTPQIFTQHISSGRIIFIEEKWCLNLFALSSCSAPEAEPVSSKSQFREFSIYYFNFTFSLWKHLLPLKTCNELSPLCHLKYILPFLWIKKKKKQQPLRMFANTGDWSYLHLIKLPLTTLDTFSAKPEPELLYHRRGFHTSFGLSSGLWFFLCLISKYIPSFVKF